MIRRFATRLFLVPTLAAFMWLGPGGCASSDTADKDQAPGDSADRLAAAVEAEAATDPEDFRLDMPAPPTVEPEQVQVRTDKALEKARLPLKQVLTKLSAPDYLPMKKQPGTLEKSEQDTRKEPPTAAVKAYVLGRAEFRAGNRWEAITQLEQARRLDPKAPQILRLLGSIYFAYGNEVKGAQRLTESIRLDPEDPQSLFLLGRFAFKKSDWEEAIYTLATSSQHHDEDDEVDPAIDYLRPYYLGQALLQRGYDAAGVDQLETFLSLPQRMTRVSTLLRELALLDRQRGRVHLQVGDAMCRLGRFADAADHYEMAADDELVESTELAPRQVYVQLAMNRPRTAEQTLVETLRASEQGGAALKLVPYVAEHTGDRARFVKLLRSLYEDTGRPSQLVLAMAQLVDDKQADGLLIDHLDARPGDRVVYNKLVARLAKRDQASLVKLLVDMIRQRPDQARQFVAQVARQDVESQPLLDQLDKLPDDQRQTAAAWYVRGAMLERLGEIEDAAAAYDRAVEIDSEFLTPQVATIELQIRLQRYDKALKLLDQVDNPDDPELRFTRARVLSKQQKYDQAEKIIDELLRQDPRNVRYRLFKANSQIADGDFDQAERTLWSVLDIDPTHEPTYVLLFELYEQNPRTDNSQWIRLMKQVQHEIPSSRIARLKMAEWYAANRQYDRAEQNLRSLLDENPNDPMALTSLVQLLNETDRLNEAEKLLNEHLESNPEDSTVPLLLLEQIAEKRGTIEAFFPRKEKYLLKQEDSFSQQMQLARLYDRWGKPDKALAALEHAVDLKPDAAPDLRITLAEMYRQQKAYDKALGQIDKALAEKPENAADLHYVRALIFHSKDDAEQGEAALLKALEVDADHPPANNDLGYLWAEEGRNLERALQMTQKAVAADPENGAYLDSLGWVLYKLGRFDDARRRLEEARTKRQGEDPVILDHLGDALWRADHKGRARQMWNDALNLARQADPQRRPDAVEMIDTLTGKIEAVDANGKPAIAPVPDEDTADKPPDQ